MTHYSDIIRIAIKKNDEESISEKDDNTQKLKTMKNLTIPYKKSFYSNFELAIQRSVYKINDCPGKIKGIQFTVPTIVILPFLVIYKIICFVSFILEIIYQTTFKL